MSYVRKIQRNGASLVVPEDRQRPPWIPHHDPDLRAWMASVGYTHIEDIPVPEGWDYREYDVPCQVCGAVGVETHHWAPREWFGGAAEKWPKGELCRPCHRFWHQVAERAAARLTVRILRSKGLHKTADNIERGLGDDYAQLPDDAA